MLGKHGTIGQRCQRIVAGEERKARLSTLPRCHFLTQRREHRIGFGSRLLGLGCFVFGFLLRGQQRRFCGVTFNELT
jgi:hypothetical protein